MMESNLGVVFPGSGSQYYGMMQKAYEEHKLVRSIFKSADEILGYSLTDIIRKGGTLKLNRIAYMMPAVFVSNYAYYQIFMAEHKSIPLYMAGHSLGEYAALACSDAITFETALKLVELRSELAQEAADASNGKMTIVKGVNPKVVEHICADMSMEDKTISIGCYNSNNQVAIVGNDLFLEEAEKRIRLEMPEAQCVNMLESAPYHSPLMREYAPKFENSLKTISIKMTKIPVLSNCYAKPYDSIEMIKEGLVKQLYTPVQWEKTISFFIDHAIHILVEIGPKNVLKTIHSEGNYRVKTLAYDELRDRIELKNMYGNKREIEKNDNTNRFFEVFQSCITASYTLENYSENVVVDDSSVKKQLYEMLELRKKIQGKDVECKEENASQALLMLQELFQLRSTPEKERVKVMNGILNTKFKQEYYKSYMEQKKRQGGGKIYVKRCNE